jgi:leader peptidase (prepilin peptidase)/N-methyltransferase
MMEHAQVTFVAGQVPWFLFTVVAATGLVVGSFLNVCILRIPDGTFFRQLRSHCPACDALIPWYLNIPLLGFAWLRGRARCCGARISWQYPVVEAATCLLFLLALAKFPFLEPLTSNPDIVVFNRFEAARFFHALCFSSVLLAASVVDLRLMIIPDVMSLGLLLTAPLVVVVHPELDWKSSLYGSLLGAGLLYGIAWTYWLLRGEVGMGFGDVKLLAGIGGWLGYQAIFPVVLLASVSGSLVGIGAMILNRKYHGRAALPFGPFLAAGAVIYLFFSQGIREYWIWMGL